ncbi:MAG: D-2-hydroxyacid dehydrogenase [Chloroflexi bacterium]|nr:MAG: D-2-hydroxyacid dehydrogenase [Chloroflexota bacterium]
MTENAIQVVVAADFSDEIMTMLRQVSDQFHIQKYFPDVPDSAYADAEILYTIRHFPTPEQAPNLKWIQVHYAGLDSVIDRPIVKQTNIEVTSASGIHAVPIAEFCIGMMLSWELQLKKMIHFQDKAEWAPNPYDVFKPHGLRGKTLGIAGYGSIGRELARIAHAMGMTVLATKRDLRATTEDHGYTEPGIGDPTGDIPERFYPPEAIGSMASVCDYLVLAVPLTEKTYHMINADVLKRMSSSCVLINIARGSVVDEVALIEALKANKIAGAILDVFEQEPLPADSPLWEMENVIISPHVAGNNTRYHERAATVFAENLRRYAEKQPLLNRFDRQTGY